ncbi:MAG: exo-alpha-sialidase, partial [Planctomycetaceae bacterium]|nr:exo-alpha-sialidase [Planctomycetaceae bacterium]
MISGRAIAATLFALLLATGDTANDRGRVYSQEIEEKLQPLSYNNPGLLVDLGVGLWAWPMPMDYDGDGDLDLLVACPDKPSNGVYYFENTSQNAHTKMPVFRAPVHLGRTTHNFQVSYVDGKPRILRPGYEYVRGEDGRFDFDKAERIYPTNNVHNNAVRGNMWRYVDYDDDGDQDLVVGVGDWTDYGWDNAYDNSGHWRNGPLHGHVYLITNNGSDTAPQYSDSPERLQAAGGDIDVYGWPSPNFNDFDGDGDLDLLCGEFLDGFSYFENTGSRKQPVFAAGRKLLNDNGQPLVMDLQMITPTAIDWDQDGDIDLIVGDEDGRVALVENTGSRKGSLPVFRAPQYFQQEADTLKFGALATPYAWDWDGDGDQDILCGNTAGYIGYFENLGMAENGLPKWAAPRLLEEKFGQSRRPFRIMAGPDGSIQGPCEAKWGYTTLSVADWDADGDPDIIYNSILSRIGLLRNDNDALVDVEFDSGLNESPPEWYWWQTSASSALTQWRTTPVAIDFDGDQKLDLVALDQEGYLVLRSAAGTAQRIFVNEDNAPWQLNTKSCGGSGRIKLAVVDWDGDGRLDVLTNSENATWYRNCESRDGMIVLKKIGNLAKRNVAGHTSSPAACDFNKDGKPDLLIGAENGRLYHILHDDCLSWTDSQLVAAPPREDSGGRFPGFVREEFVYTKASFPECHASTICRTSRGLVTAWFGGTKEGKTDVGIWVSYHDGSNWSSPKQVADGVQHNDLRYPCWNPVLYQPPGDAPTLLFFKVGPSPSEWWGEMMVSYDRGRTFRDRVRLPEGIDGPVRCKPILLPDGKTLLCGSSTEYDGWRIHFESTVLENGLPVGTWNRIGPINTAEEFNAIQPTFLQHKDGRLQVLCRTRESVLTTSFSSDLGKTWSKLQAIDLPNPNSGIEVVTLKDGRHLLIYNHLGSGKTGWGRRGLLNLAISDDGLKWKKVGVLEQEEKAEFSYPAIIQ